MTLHEAIKKIIQEKGRPMTTQQIADELNKNDWYKKKDGSLIQAFQIHGRTKNYANIFYRDGSTVSLIEQTTAIKAEAKVTKFNKPIVIKMSNSQKDEHYVLNLCDKVLNIASSRQYKFEFLRGDPNNIGLEVKLPVDGYYDELKLVIEYREKQHTDNIDFYDKPEIITVSGVHRGEQRKIYDERRRHILPEHGISLIEISYSDFNHNKQKRIIRNLEFDEIIVRQKLNKFLIIE